MVSAGLLPAKRGESLAGRVGARAPVGVGHALLVLTSSGLRLPIPPPASCPVGPPPCAVTWPGRPLGRGACLSSVFLGPTSVSLPLPAGRGAAGLLLPRTPLLAGGAPAEGRPPEAGLPGPRVSAGLLQGAAGAAGLAPLRNSQVGAQPALRPASSGAAAGASWGLASGEALVTKM